jgi:ankyrin repeat protein
MNRYLELGGNINVRDKNGMTPLLTYIATGAYESHLPWYKERGADFRATNDVGEGALHIVGKREVDEVSQMLELKVEGKEEVSDARLFRLLVKDYGCEVLDEDEKGRTALDVAAAMGNEVILKLYQRGK